MTSPAEPNPAPPSIDLTAGALVVHGLRIDDPVVVDVVARHEPGQRREALERVLAVGARGVMSMGVGLELGDVDRRVRATVDDALQIGRREMADVVGALRTAVAADLDPDRAASTVGRCLAQMESFRASLEAAVDPGRTDSHTSRLLSEVASMLGAGGTLETRLRSVLDPDADGSALAAVLGRLEQRLDDLHVAVAEERGRRHEAERGTAKGFTYEDEVETCLRRWAAGAGAVVERTSTVEGSRGGELVGDFVVRLPDGTVIVVEAKDTGSTCLRGTTGILAELQRAADNRGADIAVCLSRSESFPAEVGRFGVYGDAVLAVDDGDGTMMAVAMTWAMHQARAGRRAADGVDVALLAERARRVGGLATRLSSTKRALTDISASVQKVRDTLETIRVELLEVASDVAVALRSEAEGDVIRLDQAG